MVGPVMLQLDLGLGDFLCVACLASELGSNRLYVINEPQPIVIGDRVVHVWHEGFIYSRAKPRVSAVRHRA